jgi:hypothetical protein
VDKHLEIDKPSGTTFYQSTEPRPIKVANTAPSNKMRATEIAIETAITSEVTAVVAVMSIFCKKQAGRDCATEVVLCHKGSTIPYFVSYGTHHCIKDSLMVVLQ